MKAATVDHNELYRLPWTLPDNAISWLEPTALCNLHCEGCYRKIDQNPHKTLTEIKRELKVFQKFRKSDCISIAGGEPLLYPHIVDLVAEINNQGYKPIINSNGEPLTRELLRDLKDAGVFGFTFHIDSRQKRGGKWQGKNELELNELRLEFAEMLADSGNIACSFNSTVYAENLQFVPDMIRWAQNHIDIVQTMVFICYRQVVPSLPFDWYAGDRKVKWSDIWYHSEAERQVEIKSDDLLAIAQDQIPGFSPAAYLNGTQKANSFKWLLSERVGTKDRILGYLGPKFVELVMTGYHLRNGRYLSYVSPKSSKRGKSTMFLLWPFDQGARKAAKNFLTEAVKNPFRLFQQVNLQTIMFIQPVDFLVNGEQNMCDGCPDITVFNDELIWSCRMEELKAYGTFLRSVPRRQEARAGQADLHQ
jgi:hypothetical protein